MSIDKMEWGEAKTDIPGLPTAINANGISQAHLDNYAIHLRLEEINRKLRLNDFVPPERERLVVSRDSLRKLIVVCADLHPLRLLMIPMVEGLTPGRFATVRSSKMNASALSIVP